MQTCQDEQFRFKIFSLENQTHVLTSASNGDLYLQKWSNNPKQLWRLEKSELNGKYQIQNVLFENILEISSNPETPNTIIAAVYEEKQSTYFEMVACKQKSEINKKFYHIKSANGKLLDLSTEYTKQNMRVYEFGRQSQIWGLEKIKIKSQVDQKVNIEEIKMRQKEQLKKQILQNLKRQDFLNLKKEIQNKKLQINDTIIENLIKIMHQQGPFSNKIDEYIKNLSNEEMKKPQKNKVYNSFEELFMRVQLSEELNKTIKELDIEEKTVDKLKQIVKNGQMQKLYESLRDLIDDQENQSHIGRLTQLFYASRSKKQFDKKISQKIQQRINSNKQQISDKDNEIIFNNIKAQKIKCETKISQERVNRFNRQQIEKNHDNKMEQQILQIQESEFVKQPNSLVRENQQSKYLIHQSSAHNQKIKEEMLNEQNKNVLRKKGLQIQLQKLQKIDTTKYENNNKKQIFSLTSQNKKANQISQQEGPSGNTRGKSRIISMENQQSIQKTSNPYHPMMTKVNQSISQKSLPDNKFLQKNNKKQQLSREGVRFFMVAHFHGQISKICPTQQGRQVHQSQINHPKPQKVCKFNFNDIIIQIFRFQFVEVPQHDIKIAFKGNGTFFGMIGRQVGQKVITTKAFLSDLFIIRNFLADDKQKKAKEFMHTYYLIFTLIQLSKKKMFQQFWNTLVFALENDFINKDIIQKGLQIMSKRSKDISSNNFLLNMDASRLFLTFLTSRMKFDMRRLISQGELEIFKAMAIFSQFDNCAKQLLTCSKQENYQKNAHAMIKIMLFRRIAHKLSTNDDNFLKSVMKYFSSIQSFQEKVNILQDLRQFNPKKLQQFYESMKEKIQLQNQPIGQYIILNFIFLFFDEIDQRTQIWKRTKILEIFTVLMKRLQGSTKIQQQKVTIQQLSIKYSKLIHNVMSLQNVNQQKASNKSPQSCNYFIHYWLKIKQIDKKYSLCLQKLFIDILPKQFPIKNIFPLFQSSNKVKSIILLCNFQQGYQLTDRIIKSSKQIKIKTIQIVEQLFKKQIQNQQKIRWVCCIIQKLQNKQSSEYQFSQFYKLVKVLQQYYERNDKCLQLLQRFLHNFFKSLKKPLNLMKLLQILREIKQVKPEIRIVYLQELIANILPHLSHQKQVVQKIQHFCQRIHSDKSINQKDKQYVIDKIIRKGDKNIDQLTKQLFQCLIRGERSFKILSRYDNFQISINRILQRLSQNHIMYDDITKIKNNKIHLYNQEDLLKPIYDVAEQRFKEVQTLRKNINCLIRILNSFQARFFYQQKQLTKLLKLTGQQHLNYFISQSKIYNDLLACSSQVLNLMKLPLWRNSSISALDDILKQRKYVLSQLENLLQKFQNQQLKVADFLKNFSKQTFSVVCENIHCQKLKNNLKEYIMLIDSTTLKRTLQNMYSINELCKKLNCSCHFDKYDIESISQMLNIDQNNLKLKESFTKIRQISSKFKDLCFNLEQQIEKDQILKTVIYIVKYWRVFDLIQTKKIDSKSVLNELKQYINQVQTSILKIQDVKELQNVVLVNQLMKKSRKIEKFLKKLQQEISKRNLKYSECIFNVDSHLKQFEQLIDSSINRQTSFKYQLQQIMRKSVVRISSQSGQAHVQIICAKPKQGMAEGKKLDVNVQATVFDIKKLTEYKDKAILLVTDFQRSSQMQAIMEQNIELFKNYLNLYQIIKDIDNHLKKTMIYGYDPQQFIQQKVIQNNDYSQINKMNEQIQKISKQWVQGIKKLHSKYYILTHFMGPRLNSFVIDTLNKLYSPILMKLIDLDQQGFKDLVNAQTNDAFNVSKRTPIQDNSSIKKMNTRKRIKKNAEQQQITQKSLEKKNIEVQKSEKRSSARKSREKIIQQTENFSDKQIKSRQKFRVKKSLRIQTENQRIQIQEFISQSILEVSNIIVEQNSYQNMNNHKKNQSTQEYLSESTSIKRVKAVCEMFSFQQKQKLERFGALIQQQNAHRKSKCSIQLITCHKVQKYYYSLVRQTERPQINEILYCQRQTSFEQIQVFLKRAIIKNSRKHFIIGVNFLTQDVQMKFIDMLNDYIKNEERRMKFNESKLCFIDNSAIEKVYLHLIKKDLFNSRQITEVRINQANQIDKFVKMIENVHIIESLLPGLGKTYRAQNIIKNTYNIYFPIAGNIIFSRLLQRLKQKILSSTYQNNLIIQLGHIENKEQLQIFLFQIIFFKAFNYNEIFYLPQGTNIVIEIQNIYQKTGQNKINCFPILKILKEHRENYIFIEKFDVKNIDPQLQKIENSFVFYYLSGVRNGLINTQEETYWDFEKQFRKDANSRSVPLLQIRQIINQFFCRPLQVSRTPVSYSTYTNFIKLLFIAFKTFSQNGCFLLSALKQIKQGYPKLDLQNARINFLKCCIRNCIQFLEATVNTNQFNDEEKSIKMNSESMQQDFRQKLSKFPFLIMPAHDFQNYEFVYLKSQEIDMAIKSLIVTQSIFQIKRNTKTKYTEVELSRGLNPQIVNHLFKQRSLQNRQKYDLEKQIFRIIHQLSGNNKLDEDNKDQQLIKKQVDDYSLTLDNFFKMCLITQRAIAHIPIVIMGQSGVGKTALIRFLVQVVFQHRFQIFNIHAGINEQKLIEFYKKICEQAQQVKIFNGKLWVFFDEFNTTDQLSYIKEMIIDRRFQGEPVPDNVVFIAACNPYRKKKISSFQAAGIRKKQNQFQQKQSGLAFKVKPPPLSMVTVMWDYQQLRQKQTKNYINKILQNLEFPFHQILVKTITQIHQNFKTNNQISSVSLRDVTRFKELVIWFKKFMPRKQNEVQNQEQPNYLIDEDQRAVALSLAFCYSLRIANKQQREQFLHNATKQMNFMHSISSIVKNQQQIYVRKLQIQSERIAINFSLRQNVFTTLVCVMNKIPILIIGNPGNSKSLSIRMISSQLRGLNSESEFCQKLPELVITYFQGSETCTSKGVEAVFEKAIKFNENFRQKSEKQKNLGLVESCVLFDEIGLAQKSIHNPLKVLHSKLQTNRKQICFIGISNWQLDAAKMSRFLVLSRTKPQRDELEDTSIKILKSYLGNRSYEYEKYFKNMANWYYDFIERWDKKNINSHAEGFFGLRDFYCYIKHVAEELHNNNPSPLQDIIKKAILTNFDGKENSLATFFQISGIQYFQDDLVIDPIKLVLENLSKNSSRCLLLIIKGDALIPIINRTIKIDGKKRRIQCIYGSTFKLDKQSEEYNLEVTSSIIAHMSRGNILTFKDPNSSIQTSMYDVFNRSFTFSGHKKFCRVAVGANSNPKCAVNENFGAVVFMDENKVNQTDLAFLNRFQKHFLTLQSIITNFQRQIVYQVCDWVQNLLRFRKKTQYKKQQHFLINSSQQSIVTLVIKYKYNDKTRAIKAIKKALLKNATSHFYIAFKDQIHNYISEGFKQEVNFLLNQTQDQQEGQMKIQNMLQDMQIQEFPKINDQIIFTYDESVFSSSKYKFLTQQTYKIRLSQIKSQKQLKGHLIQYFKSSYHTNLHILIDFQRQFFHINHICHLLSSLKKQNDSMKEAFLIIRLSQSSLDAIHQDHINISYLLEFEQQFIDSLVYQDDFIQEVQGKSLKLLFKQRKIEEQKLEQLYTKAISSFGLYANQNVETFPTKISIQKIKQFEFKFIMDLIYNKNYRQKLLNFIQNNLSNQQIDLSMILNSKQDRKTCSNPKQSFQKYFQRQINNLICTFFAKNYQNHTIFGFQIGKVIQFYFSYYNLTFIQEIYKNNSLILDNFLSVAIEDLLFHNKNSQNKGQNQRKDIQLQSIGLFPCSLCQFSYLSQSSINCIYKSSEKIIEVYGLSSLNQQNQSNFEQLIKKCKKIISEKSVLQKKFIFKNSQQTLSDMLPNNLELQILFFFDILFNLNGNSFKNELVNFERIVFIFVQILRKLSSQQKILMISINHTIWSDIFNVWSSWIQGKDVSMQKQIICFYFNQIKQLSEWDSQNCAQPAILMIKICSATVSLNSIILKLNQDVENKFVSMRDYIDLFAFSYNYIELICKQLRKLNANELGNLDQSELSKILIPMEQNFQRLKITKRFIDLNSKVQIKKQNINEQYKFDNKMEIQNDFQLQNLLIQNQSQKNQLLHKFIKFNNQEKSFQSTIQQFLLKELENYKEENNLKLSIYEFIGLEIYPNWIIRLLKEKQTKQSARQNQHINSIETELILCIQSFFSLCNQSSYFTNCSAPFFLENIFGVLNNFDTAQDMIKYFESYVDQNEQILMYVSSLLFKQNQIQPQIKQKRQIHQQNLLQTKQQNQTWKDSNLVVAITNFFVQKITFKLKIEAQNQMRQKMILQGEQTIAQQALIIQKYIRHFEYYCNKDIKNNAVLQIFVISFCKVYSKVYLVLLKSSQRSQLLKQIDICLLLNSKMASSLRLYLVKILLQQQKIRQNLKLNYIDNEKCKWIRQFKQIIQGKSYELYIPPFLKVKSRIVKLIQQFRQSSYGNYIKFEKIWKESQQDIESKYNFLTFMMSDVYTACCPLKSIRKMEEIINKDQQLTNELESRLLKCYLNQNMKSGSVLLEQQKAKKSQKANQNISKKKNSEKSNLHQIQKSQKQKFQNKELVYLNYLNIIISQICLKKENKLNECPLLDMFFVYNKVENKKKSNKQKSERNDIIVPTLYSKHLQQRFLINGPQNLWVKTIDQWIVSTDTSGYYKCTNKCDFLYVIGSKKQVFGCPLPATQGLCAWCKGKVGGLNHKIARQNQGSRKIQPVQMPILRQNMRQRHSIPILSRKLIGMNLNFTKNKQFIGQLIDNNRVSGCTKYTLIQICLSMWEFLCNQYFIFSQEIQKTFSVKSSQQLVNNINKLKLYFYKQIGKSLNFISNQIEDHENNLIWHFGMANTLMEFSLKYKPLNKKNGLLKKCIERDNFENQWEKCIMTFSSGNQKLKLVNQNRCHQAGLKLQGFDLIKQSGLYTQQIENYPNIRLLNFTDDIKKPSLQNLFRQYNQKIRKQYHLLNYFIINLEKIELLKDFRKIYLIQSKLLKLFDMKISRRHAQKQSITILIDSLFNERLQDGQKINKTNQQRRNKYKNQANTLKQQIAQFCRIWNQMRKRKYLLKYQCQNNGQNAGDMSIVTTQLSLQSMGINFFLDTKGDNSGKFLRSFIEVTSRQYNNVCSQLLKLIDDSNSNSSSYQLLNPTQLFSHHKTLQLTKQRIEEDLIQNYSMYPVQYGSSIPFYSLNKIESLLKQFICNQTTFFNQDIKTYKTINFIGEQMDFIIQIRQAIIKYYQKQQQFHIEQWNYINDNSSKQSKTLKYIKKYISLLPNRQEIQQYIIQLRSSNSDNFLKTLTQLKGCFEIVLNYYRLLSHTCNPLSKMQYFIRQQKIKLPSIKFMQMEIFANLPVIYVLPVYELVQLYMLKQMTQCIDEQYKRDKLTEKEENYLYAFLEQMALMEKQQIEKNMSHNIYNDSLIYWMKVAAYRFAARRLTMTQIKPEMHLASYLSNCQQLWPMGFNIACLSQLQSFQHAFSIPLSKTQSLLQKLPLQIKKSKRQIISTRQQQQQISQQRKRQPELLITKSKYFGSSAIGKRKNL